MEELLCGSSRRHIRDRRLGRGQTQRMPRDLTDGLESGLCQRKEGFNVSNTMIVKS